MRRARVSTTIRFCLSSNCSHKHASGRGRSSRNFRCSCGMALLVCDGYGRHDGSAEESIDEGAETSWACGPPLCMKMACGCRGADGLARRAVLRYKSSCQAMAWRSQPSVRTRTRSGESARAVLRYHFLSHPENGKDAWQCL